MAGATALLDRQTRARELIRARVLASTDRAFRTLGSYNEKDVEVFTSRVVPIVKAGQLATGNITSAYVNSLIAQMTGDDALPDGFEVRDFRGVDLDEVYRRPFVELWSGLKAGQEWLDAFEVAADRNARLADDDLSLAHRNAARDAFGANDVSSYRRVIRPEMSSAGTCGLCVAASDQTYKSEDLLPIHTRCNCDVMPIIGDNDPGRRVNDEDLTDVYARASAAGDGGRTSLASFRVQVADHGELGPILRPAGQAVTTESDL